MNDSELAAKLYRGVVGRITLSRRGMNVPHVMVRIDEDNDEIFPEPHELLALSRAVCEADGLRVVETSYEGCAHEHCRFDCQTCAKCTRSKLDLYAPKVPSQAMRDGAAGGEWRENTKEGGGE